MATVKPPQQQDAAGPTGSEQDGQKKSKRKRFWAKERSSVRKKPGLALPPRVTVEYSTNWKALQQLMRPTTDAKKAPESQSQIRTKGETCVVEKGHRRTPGVKPERAAGSKAHPESQTSVVAKESGLKPDTSGNKEREHSERKGVRSSPGPPEGHCSPHKKKRTKIEPEPEKHTGPDIWFDDVDPDDIEAAMGPEAAVVARQQIEAITGNPHPVGQTLEKMLVKDGAFEGLTRAVAMDCEMVGVGLDRVNSILARVSIVNQFGKCVYDKYVKPTEKVTDYRTWVSGIRPNDVKNGEAFKVVQKEVADILQGRTLVGHAVHNDLKILFLDHPKKMIRDTQKYKPFKTVVKCGRPSLKHLCQQILKVKVQGSEHSSVQDAQATMRLYTLARQRWEAELKAKRKTKKDVAREEKREPSS
uniref:RNA exonuclease 4 n=1 Tax=Pristiophorus japonicus TaxID=55135 RepID=UPI00398F1167